MSPGLVLVTGASGRVGQRLCAALRERGWRVRALVHRHDAPGADEQVRGSLGDGASLDRALAGVDAIAHLAASTHARSARTYRDVNLEGTRRLVESARRTGTPALLHVSTRAISPGGGSYSRSKAAAERIVRSGLPASTIVRLPEVYGAGGSEGVDRIIANARAGRHVIVVRGPVEVRPLHADDAVAALAAALANDRCRGQDYTLAAEAFTMTSFAEECIRILGSRSTVTSIPPGLVAALCLLARVAPLPLYPDQLRRLRSAKPDPTPAAATDLGFAPRSLRAGLLGGSGTAYPGEVVPPT